MSVVGEALVRTSLDLDGFFRRHPDQLYLWRREGDSFVLQDYNDEAHRVSRGSLERLLGQDVRVLAASAPEVVEAMERAWREDRSVPAEFRYRYRSSGEERELHVVYVPISPTHLISHAVDFTDILEDARSLRARGEALEAHRERLRALAAYQDRVREEERTRLSRELHDELGQRLTALHLDVSRSLGQVDGPLKDELAAVAEGIGQALAATREIARKLRPSILDDLGLPEALRWQLRHLPERSAVATSLDVDDPEPEMEPRAAAALFRIAQEALTNATRHAGATRVAVRLRATEGEVVLDIEDDGVGFGPDAPGRDGLGLLTMEERAVALGGRFRLSSAPGEGCRIEVRVPLGGGALGGELRQPR